MNKTRLVELARRVGELAGLDAPVIVGSQTVHAAVERVPDSVDASFEADFLLDAIDLRALRAVGRELGAFSEFQDRTGTHADPVRRSILVLPQGWEARLLPLHDLEGRVVALCVEAHDAAVTKIAAGREKDWVFIRECLAVGILNLRELLERCEHVERPTQRVRLSRNLGVLQTRLTKAGVAFDRHAFDASVANLGRGDEDPADRGGIVT